MHVIDTGALLSILSRGATLDGIFIMLGGPINNLGLVDTCTTSLFHRSAHAFIHLDKIIHLRN